MTTNITAYLVDVEQRTIRAVAIDPANSLADIRGHIGCGLIDMVRIDSNHSVVVDDNGLTDELPCFAQLEGYDSPLAGNLPEPILPRCRGAIGTRGLPVVAANPESGSKSSVSRQGRRWQYELHPEGRDHRQLADCEAGAAMG